MQVLMYQCHILNHLHLSQVILTVLQLGFTETFEHIDAGDYLYIICTKGRTYLAKHILLQVSPYYLSNCPGAPPGAIV